MYLSPNIAFPIYLQFPLFQSLIRRDLDIFFPTNNFTIFFQKLNITNQFPNMSDEERAREKRIQRENLERRRAELDRNEQELRAREEFCRRREEEQNRREAELNQREEHRRNQWRQWKANNRANRRNQDQQGGQQ